MCRLKYLNVQSKIGANFLVKINYDYFDGAFIKNGQRMAKNQDFKTQESFKCVNRIEWDKLINGPYCCFVCVFVFPSSLLIFVFK